MNDTKKLYCNIAIMYHKPDMLIKMTMNHLLSTDVFMEDN